MALAFCLHPSNAYVTTASFERPYALVDSRPGLPTHDLRGLRRASQSGGTLRDSSLQRAGSSSGVFSSVKKLRGGSPAVAMVAGSEIATAALNALKSASAIVPLGGGALFAQVRGKITGKISAESFYC